MVFVGRLQLWSVGRPPALFQIIQVLVSQVGHELYLAARAYLIVQFQIGVTGEKEGGGFKMPGLSGYIGLKARGNPPVHKIHAVGVERWPIGNTWVIQVVEDANQEVGFLGRRLGQCPP